MLFHVSILFDFSKAVSNVFYSFSLFPNGLKWPEEEESVGTKITPMAGEITGCGMAHHIKGTETQSN